MKEYLNSLKIAEISGKKIGLFRIICSIFGGLSVAYLGMTLFAFLFSVEAEGLIVSIFLYCTVWAFLALWISLSKTRYIALMRWLIPTLVFGIALLIIFKV